MGKFIDKTGYRYNYLTVISRHGFYGRKITWLCLCDCGNYIIAPLDRLMSGNTKSCGCFEQRRIKHSNSRFTTFRAGAKHRNISMELDRDRFEELEVQPCYYCGEFDRNGRTGIDRYYNDEGYTYDNSVSCCSQCNTSKLNHTAKSFIDMCKRVAR